MRKCTPCSKATNMSSVRPEASRGGGPVNLDESNLSAVAAAGGAGEGQGNADADADADADALMQAMLGGVVSPPCVSGRGHAGNLAGCPSLSLARPQCVRTDPPPPHLPRVLTSPPLHSKPSSTGWDGTSWGASTKWGPEWTSSSAPSPTWCRGQRPGPTGGNVRGRGWGRRRWHGMGRGGGRRGEGGHGFDFDGSGELGKC